MPSTTPQPSAAAAFPRGGAGGGTADSALSHLEWRDLAEKADRDLLRTELASSSTGSQASRKKSGQKRSQQQANDKAAESQLEAEGAKKRMKTKSGKAAAVPASGKKSKTTTDANINIHTLSFKRLLTGMSVLGVVREINELDLVVSLPNQMTGYISITEISDEITALVEKVAGAEEKEDDADDDTDMKDASDEPLSLPSLHDLFCIGQPIPCVVVSTEVESNESQKKKKRIELSAKPQLVNNNISYSDVCAGMTLLASVSSIEDHGYILNFGIKDTTGFLNKKHAATYISEHTSISKLTIGQLIYTSVLNVNEARKTFSVTIDPAAVSKSAIPGSRTITYSALTAGSLIPCKIKHIADDGIVVSFLGLFEGSIDLFHIGVIGSPADSFKVGQKITARVLHVDAVHKRIGLTLASHLTGWKVLSSSVEDGTIWESATVVRVDGSNGLVMKNEDGTLAYLHSTRISDSEVVSFDGKTKHAVGTTHRVRVIGYDACDGIVQVSMKPSVLNAVFFRKSDVKAGMVVKVTIMKIESFGLVVALSETIHGLVLPSHMAETAVSNPSRMFKVGAIVKARVLSSDASKKRLLLTLKKPLVSSKLPIVGSFDSSMVGVVTDGYIMAVKSFGCIVGFFDDVKALVPISELSERFVKNPADLFNVGQVVKCKILTCDPETQKMTASFKRAHDGSEDLDTANKIDSLNVGEIVQGRVLTILPDAALVELQPSLIRGMISKHHLTDHHSHADAMFAALQEGAVFKELLIYEKDAQRGRVHVSAKPMLLATPKPELKVGSVAPGYIRNITDAKCFVGFGNGLVGAVKLHNVSDNFVSKLSDHIQQGQSVLALVSELDESSGKIDLVLKPSLVSAASSQTVDVSYLTSFFKEEDTLRAQMTEGDIKSWIALYGLGSIIKGVVKQRAPFGYILDIGENSNRATGLVTVEVGKSGSYEVGSEMSCRIVDADVQKKILDLRVVNDATEMDADVSQLKTAFESKTIVDAVVEVVKSAYIIMTLPGYGNRVVYAASQGYNTSCTAGTLVSKTYKVGQTLKVQVGKLGLLSSDKTKKNANGYFSQRTLANIQAISANLQKSQRKAASGEKRIIKDPIDTSISALEDLTYGTVVKGRILSIKATQMHITIGSNLRGRVHISELVSNISDIKDPLHPFKSYSVGEILSFKVVGFHENGKTHTFLPITHRNPTSKTIIELTLRPEDMALESGVLAKDVTQRHPSFEAIEIGSTHQAFVSKVEDDAVWVTLGPFLMGRVTAMEATATSEMAQNLAKHFPLGRAVTVYVLSKNDDKKRTELNLSIRACLDTYKDVTFPLSLETLKVGLQVVGKVVKVMTGTGLSVQIADRVYGRIPLVEISDACLERPTESYKVGSYVTCTVMAANIKTGNLDLTLRSWKEGDVFKVDQIVKGYVKNISEGGAFVYIGNGTVARVRIKELSDSFVKDWKSIVDVGDRVEGRILSVDNNNRVEMSLKKSAVDPTYVPPGGANTSQLTISELSKGMKVAGTIKSIESFGVFIKIDDSNLSGLCHISEIADKPVTKIESLYSPGDPVKAIILKVDLEKKRISFGLKASYFDEEDAMDEDEDESEDEEDEEDNDENDLEGQDDEDEEDDEEADTMDVEGDEEMEEEQDDDEDDGLVDSDDDNMVESGEPSTLAAVTQVQPLDLGGLGWGEDADKDADADEGNSDLDSDDDSDDGEGGGDKNASKKSRRAKKREKKEAEERLVQQEQALMASDAPDSAEAFDRILMGSPSSSFLWIKYMAFHLQMADIPKAREVAENALKTINFRETQERVNVWVAMLNLENSYGDKESLMKVFERAVAYNEPKAMYMNLANIYERTEKFEDLDQLHQGMVKRFKESCKVWVACGLSLLKRGKIEESRKILQRSLQSLAKRKHLKIICKFAQMEFKHGEPERGRTLFEGIVSHHPKRLDMWSVYLDMEIKTGDISITRRLFERVITLKLSSKKMKFLFKKYLEFEKKHGTDEGVQHVKEAAMAYVERISRD